MKFNKALNKAAYFSALTALPLTALYGCGPQSQAFSILPASQSAYQGSVANNKVDLLFVIDNSGSMLTKQEKLATGFSSFTSLLTAKGFDFHISIVTSDVRSSTLPTFYSDGHGGQLGPYFGQEGLFQGATRVIKNTDSYDSLFQSTVKVGQTGDSYAKSLDAIKLSLSSALLAANNTGFLRADAHLAVISLSDADDNDSTASTADVISFLETLKPDRFDVLARTYKKNFTVSTVAVQSLSDPDCAPLGGLIEVGTKMISLANATNGSVASICKTDFGPGLSQISQRIAEAITEIPLASVPELSTLKITFNGVAVAKDATNGWTYSSSGNKIVFHGSAIPSDNTSIGIDYTPNDIIR